MSMQLEVCAGKRRDGTAHRLFDQAFEFLGPKDIFESEDFSFAR
jgi:hypothetical protein